MVNGIAIMWARTHYIFAIFIHDACFARVSHQICMYVSVYNITSYHCDTAIKIVEMVCLHCEQALMHALFRFYSITYLTRWEMTNKYRMRLNNMYLYMHIREMEAETGSVCGFDMSAAKKKIGIEAYGKCSTEPTHTRTLLFIH